MYTSKNGINGRIVPDFLSDVFEIYFHAYENGNGLYKIGKTEFSP